VLHPSWIWMGGRHKCRRTQPSVLAFALASPSAIPVRNPLLALTTGLRPSFFTLTLHTHTRLSRLRRIKPQKRTIKLSSNSSPPQRRPTMLQNRDFAVRTVYAVLTKPTENSDSPNLLRWTTGQVPKTSQNRSKSGPKWYQSGHIRAYDFEPKSI
jgi:hypothetical protein